MASSQYEAMQQRQEYRNLWHTDLLSTVQFAASRVCAQNYYLHAIVMAHRRADIGHGEYLCIWGFDEKAVHICCQTTGEVEVLHLVISTVKNEFGFSVCAPCVSYSLRKRALYNDMTRYQCCAGYMPWSGKCKESSCPEFCLFTEVAFCFSNSVSSTRFLLQDEFNIQTTKCDNCIIAFMLIVNQIACIFHIIACIVGSDELKELSHMLTCFAHLVYCSVCAFMQTQHKVEMDKRDGKFGPASAMEVPPMQIMSRMDQEKPPAIGCPPSAMGQPYYNYPPSDSNPYPPNQPLSLGYYPPSTNPYPPPSSNPYPPPSSANPYPPLSANYYPPSSANPYAPLPPLNQPQPQHPLFPYPPMPHPPPQKSTE